MALQDTNLDAGRASEPSPRSGRLSPPAKGKSARRHTEPTRPITLMVAIARIG